jgi:hypothetical protein
VRGGMEEKAGGNSRGGVVVAGKKMKRLEEKGNIPEGEGEVEMTKCIRTKLRIRRICRVVEFSFSSCYFALN